MPSVGVAGMADDLIDLADPGSVFGQLRFGSGAGWLGAAAASDGRVMLRECLRSDPRWDRQVEHRADYYATLAIRLRFSAADLDLDVLCGDERARWLGLEVLGRLAVRGDDAGIPVLQSEISRGDSPIDSDEIARLLAEIPGGRGITSLCPRVVEARDDAGLVELIDETEDVLPWMLWAGDDHRVARALKEVEQRNKQRSEGDGEVLPGSTASLEEILASPRVDLLRGAYQDRFLASNDADEVVLLRDAANGSWGPRRRFGLRLLGLRGDESALESSIRVLEQETTAWEASTARRYLKVLPAARTLPLAREWLANGDERFVELATSLIAAHGTEADLPLMRAEFARSWECNDIYRVGELAEAFGRFPREAPHPELDLVYRESWYSWARQRAAASLALTDPAFSTTRAIECLWDCEERTRIIGIEHADQTNTTVRERLTELASDPFEDEDVRDAAHARLADE